MSHDNSATFLTAIPLDYFSSSKIIIVAADKNDDIDTFFLQDHEITFTMDMTKKKFTMNEKKIRLVYFIQGMDSIAAETYIRPIIDKWRGYVGRNMKGIIEDCNLATHAYILEYEASQSYKKRLHLDNNFIKD
jgi:hypothetical protein